MAHRVLVVTYYFPPSGGPGVQRVLKFVKYLSDFGWQPEVLTVDAGAYPEEDPSLASDVPEDVPVHRTRSWDPYQLYSRWTGRDGDEAVAVGSVAGRVGWKEQMARWIRANVFLPDARVGWVPFAVWSGRRRLQQSSFDAILTSGPPHSVHLAGFLLQRLMDVPWVADFRDPWTDINYYAELPHTALARRIDRALERLVAKRASAITTVSPTWSALLAGKADGRTPVHVVHNGFDPEDFSEVRQPALSDEYFDLTYVGSLYASRNPTGLWQMIRRLRDRGELAKLRIRLVGSVEAEVEAALQRYGLTDCTETIPYVPHAEAIATMQQAGLLLLVIEAFPADRGMITGKLYEYLAAGCPVLGLGPPEGDAAALLQKTGGGQMVERAPSEALAEILCDHYDAWAAGEPRRGADPDALRPYTRRAQTERLAEVLRQSAFGVPD